jgi:hypothetical protein
MALLRCEVIEWVGRGLQGWVRVRVLDVADRAHVFVDKAPV